MKTKGSTSRLGWRAPDAERKANELLAEMWRCLKLEGNRLLYTDVDLFDGLVPVLSSLIRFPSKWYHGEVGHYTRRAALDAKKAGKEDLAGFLEELNRTASPLLNAPLKPYRMWTKLSVSGLGTRNRYVFMVGDCRVMLSQSLPKDLCLEDYFISGIGQIHPNEPRGGIFAIASGRFRSNQQAGSGLHRAIADLSAVINFSYLGRIKEWHSGKSRPKSKLLMSDNQYLFQGKNNLNKSAIWYNSDFRDDFWAKVGFGDRDLENSIKYVRYILKSVELHSSGRQIMSAIRMLTEGWASHDVNHRILRSWTAFEILLSRSSEKADRYEEIIKRATFVAKQPKLWEMRLLHAALTRNRYIHENEASAAAEAIAQSLDAYFIGLVEWILFSRVKFDSHRSLLDMLDLSPDIAILRKQAEAREKAIEVLNS